jgi:hypothetical protein
MQPQDADETPTNPFDFWEGANFKIKIRKVEGWVNYDKSEFDGVSELSSDETYLEGVYNSLHPIGEFTDPKFYKSYADLEKKMNDVLGLESEMSMAQQNQMNAQSPAPVMRETPPQSIEEMATVSTDEPEEEEDTMSYFAKLAAG